MNRVFIPQLEILQGRLLLFVGFLCKTSALNEEPARITSLGNKYLFVNLFEIQVFKSLVYPSAQPDLDKLPAIHAVCSGSMGRLHIV